MQPLNRSFCCCPQKPRKALCGRRCRPQGSAEGKQRNPSAFTCLFSYRPSVSAKSGKNRPKRLFVLQGLCLPDVGLYLAARGDTGTHTAVTSALQLISISFICTHLAYFRMLCFRGFRLFWFRHGRGRNSAGAHIYKLPHTRRHSFCIERVKRFFKFRFCCRTLL